MTIMPRILPCTGMFWQVLQRDPAGKERSGQVQPVKEWRIHLGAHKTATTHVQDTLLAHRDQMARRGVDYIPREAFGPLQRRYSNPGHWRRRFWSRPLANQFMRQAQALRGGAETVLVSDEDLLGYSDGLLSPVFYPSFRGAHIVTEMQKTAPVTLFLGVRSYDRLLPSAYAQMMKSFAPDPYWQSRLGADVLKTPPSWFDLIERLMAAFPGAALRVWRQEDYSAHWQKILTAFAGRNVGEFPQIPPPTRTTSPSQEAIHQAEALDRSLSVEERRMRVKKIFYNDGPNAAAGTPFRPYQSETVSALRQKYEQDLQRIARNYPDMLIRIE